MCFSSSVSFATAGLLAIIGALTLRQVKNRHQVMFALVPLLFAIQQATEGMVWLSFTHPLFIPWQAVATRVYLFFAQVVWPAWMPFALLMIEKKAGARWRLQILGVVGVVVSGLLGASLVLYNVVPQIACNNISYIRDLPYDIGSASFLIYAIPTLLPFFVSSMPYMWLFGALVTGALGASYWFWYHAAGSVWCFFAAALSAMIVLLI